ncbi:MAG: hypothetical protein GY779_18350, partial [Gammaproteobacteria bacterium]|nr:hypothetical protein [Gammaproteobacteria bacterium]
TVYTVDVTPVSEGVVVVNVQAGVAIDQAGNANNEAATPLNVTYDITEPSVTISGPASPINTPFTATFTFSEAVSGFTDGDIDVSNGDVSAFATSDNIVYTALITPQADGDVTIDVADAVAVDSAGNDNIAASQYSVSYDSIAPTVEISSDSVQVNSSFTATFTFSEAVTGFTIDDIDASNGTIDNFIASSSTVYTADITPVSEGVVEVTVQAGVAIDQAGNPNSVANTPLNVTYDATGPGVTISGPVLTINTLFTATITFNEVVSGFTDSDIDVSNADISALTTSDNIVYTILITPQIDGDVTIDVGAAIAVDSAGNGNRAASQYSVTYDSMAPTVGISSDSTHVNSSFTATFTFSEAVIGFTIDDIDTTNATIDNFNLISLSVYTVDITPVSEGIVTIDVNANVTTVLTGNHNNVAATTLNVTFDVTEPSVTISGPVSTINTPFMATFTFSEAVSGFTSSDINVNNGDVSAFTTSDNIVYTALITPQTYGDLTIDVAAAVAVDNANNSNTAASQFRLEAFGLLDVIKILQILSGVTPSQPGYLDINENGKADMGDVLLLLRDF